MSNIIEGDIDITSLIKTRDFLSRAVKNASSELEIAGAIQAFECCYELTWHTMQKILAYRGEKTGSPRTTFRLAALEKLIEEPEVWFTFIVQRNLTTHTYNKEYAEDIVKVLPKFLQEVDIFIAGIKK